MRDITLGQYYPVSSRVHSLDPRIKIVSIVLFIVFTFIAKTFLGFLLAALFILFTAHFANIPLKTVFSSVKGIAVLLIITFIVNIFFLNEGNVLVSFLGLTITDSGLIRAIFMALRLVLLVASASILTLTTSPIALTDGLESLFLPLKLIGFPAHEIAMMMSIALRFIPTLAEETDKIMKAQSARGAVFDSGGLFARAKSVIPLLIPLFVSAFRRAEELAMAMEARCYHGGEGRTRLKVLKVTAADGVAFAIVLMCCALLLVDALVIARILPFLSGI